MKKIPSVIAILIFCLIALITTPHLCFSDEIIEKDYVPNEVLVRFHGWVDEKDKAVIRGQLSARLIKTIKSIQVEYWKLPEAKSTEEVIEYLKKMPEVESAEPNHLYKPKTLPNDPHFNKLWYLKNNGQNVGGVSGTTGADIKAINAWDIEKGSKDIVIAVIDSGVAFEHPDLQENIWSNKGETPNNGIDDDNNGFIDDIHGWDFVNDDFNPSDYSKDVYGDGHGTHVAGTIAAKGNNGITNAFDDGHLLIKRDGLYIGTDFSNQNIEIESENYNISYKISSENGNPHYITCLLRVTENNFQKELNQRIIKKIKP